MDKIRSGDDVIVLAGRDKGKRGTVLKRIDEVMTLLPRAQKQAHERIIGGRRVDNAEKILSLYEPDVHVIIRGKAGADVRVRIPRLRGWISAQTRRRPGRQRRLRPWQRLRIGGATCRHTGRPRR